MKHALIRNVLGSDQYISIDGRFGHQKIVETIKEEIQKRIKVLPPRDVYVVDLFRGPRVGEGKLGTMKVGSPLSQFENLI